MPSNLDIDAIKKIINISEEFCLPPRIAQLIYQRGVRMKDVRVFLAPGIENLHPPSLLPDIDIAIERIKYAIDKGEKILIFGDFDADGITSTALLYDALTLISDRVGKHIPSRLNEGYDLGKDAVVEKANEGYNLMITTDCGSKAVDSIDTANELGMDVIVSDHHLMGDEIPKAIAIVNPVRDDSSYPYKYLAGVGVVYKLVKALSETYSQIDADSYLDLVALGTIADVVPLTGENRILVKLGIDMMKKQPKPWMDALCQTSGIDPKRLTSWHLAYSIVPRINSAGRLGDADISLDMLIARDKSKSIERATELEKKNRERKRICDVVYKEVIEVINKDGFKDAIVLASPKWHSGVIGIVATRLVEKFGVPVVLISTEIPPARGSVRSDKGFDTIEALEHASDVLIRFGGHKEASGFLIDEENIPHFKELFLEYVRSKDYEKTPDKEHHIAPDITCDLEEIDRSLTEGINLLEPFGVNNPEPVFQLRCVKVLARPEVIKNYHLRFQVTDGKHFLSAYYHNGVSKLSQIYPGREISIIGTPYIRQWRDLDYIELLVKAVGAPLTDKRLNIKIGTQRADSVKAPSIKIVREKEKVAITHDEIDDCEHLTIDYYITPRGYHEMMLWREYNGKINGLNVCLTEEELVKEEGAILRQIPRRAELVRLYRRMVSIAEDDFIGFDQIKNLLIEGINRREIRCAIMIFNELGLLVREGDGLRVNKNPPPDIKLDDSVFFRLFSAERERLEKFFKHLRAKIRRDGRKI
ncbi:MAG: single-stranded-DNA-specific exonuclease RecJ [Candidatus Coatesbacteria bacterium]|nr:MAG: single-stranded-DNA-specific exonuclease RecJ [Candidatus Coatesbacteria bacterium]